jgi:transcriptional regulator with GAF, ATPase, and Fis domain
VLASGPEVTLADLPAEIRRPSLGKTGEAEVESIDDSLPLSAALDAFIRARVRKALEAVGGNQTEAAKRLGLPQSNLSRLMKRLGLR